MENSENMTTLSQVMERLKERGVHREFRMNENCEMKFENSDKNYLPSDLIIMKTYRFEGDSNPDDNAVLYLAKDTAGNMGMIIDSYGADSNYPGEEFDKFLRDIPIEESEDYSY
jgi:3-phosphoglycerate kinase